MRLRQGAIAALIVVSASAWILVTPQLAQAANSRFPAGMPLSAALRSLSADGLDLVYSDQVVRADMKVRATVTSTDPRAQLDELLAQHDLAAIAGPRGSLIVIRRKAPAVISPSPPQQSPSGRFRMEEEIDVEPKALSLIGDEPPPPLTLHEEDIGNRAKLADDVFRALDALPGVTTGDVSAEMQIRGARRDETLVLLDGQELYEPFHLRDFDNPLSIVDASTLERVSLLTGAFPVSYGDRVAGVLDMTSRPPSNRRVLVSADLLGAEIQASDTWADGRLGWLASGRRGSTDLIGRAFDVEDPRFWDLFGKAIWELTSTQSARANALMARDSFHYSDQDEIRQIHTDYDSSYLWLSHQAILSDSIFVNTTANSSLIDQQREGFEDDGLRSYEVHDDRRFSALGLKQSWGIQAGKQHFISVGLGYEELDARYAYESSRDPSNLMPADEGRSFALDDRLTSGNTSLYASDRFDPFDSITFELGLRYDSQTARDSHTVSPRLSAAWSPTPGNALRIAWGRYAQSHRPYELMVEDGDAVLYQSEESQHWAVSYEHAFAASSRLPLQSIRAEAYARHTNHPRPRYENLFSSYHPFPEGEVFRVRVEPGSADARGVEFLVRGRAAPRWNWWLNYALADTTDRIDGDHVPRRVDQTHSLNVDVTFTPTPLWQVNLAWLHHTGWPVTEIMLREVDGVITPVTGEINATRLKDYNRIDMRVGRDFRMRIGTITVFLDAQNILNSRNEAGIELRIGEESGDLETRPERWPGFLATGGFTWRF